MLRESAPFEMLCSASVLNINAASPFETHRSICCGPNVVSGRISRYFNLFSFSTIRNITSDSELPDPPGPIARLKPTE